MNLKQLRALVAVAETGNVTRAAMLLNGVQPAVSRYPRMLEHLVVEPWEELARQRVSNAALHDAGNLQLPQRRLFVHR